MRVTPWQIIQKVRYKNPSSPTEEEREFRRRFLDFYPDQEANVLSFQTNPQCRCSGEMVARITKDSEALRSHLKRLFQVEEPIDLVIPRSVAGEVHTIANDDAQYRDLLAQATANQWQYRGVSVLKMDDDRLKIYFW